MDQRGDHMKMNFEYFQIEKLMLQTVRAEKVHEKNGIICLVSIFPWWVIVLKLSEKVHFLQFCAGLSKKSKSIKAIYIYACEKSRYALSENNIVYMLWPAVLESLGFEVEDFCEIPAESASFLIFSLLISHERWLRPL